MSFTYRKSRSQKVLVKCAAMRAAKERKRMAEAESAVECGRIVFTGPMFGGEHVMVLRVASDGRNLLPDVDGLAFRALTVFGLARLVAKRIMGKHWQNNTKGDSP